MTTKTRARLGLAALLAAASALPGAALAATHDTSLASRASGAAGAKGNDDSWDGALSADGRYVAFKSSSTNLPDDPDNTADIFRRDRTTNATILISRATGANGAKAVGGKGGEDPSISGDGRFVAFDTMATNVSPADTDSRSDVYVRDVQTNITILVSRATGAAGAKGNDHSFDPSISADGRYVAFVSLATNLGANDGVPQYFSATSNPSYHVYVRDLQANTTTLVSRATGAAGAPGNDRSRRPAISANGRKVAFYSQATNLSPADTDAVRDVYVRDLQANTTTLASRAAGAAGAKGNGDSYFPSLSADGRYVAFGSFATNLSAADTDAASDVFVRDLQANTTTLASRATGAAGAKGNADSNMGWRVGGISEDGQRVAFDAVATNLSPDDADSRDDVFVRDLAAGTTTLVSRASGAGGAKGNGDSGPAVISGDGRVVAFSSRATNLHADDTDIFSDVYVRELTAPTQPPPTEPPPPTRVLVPDVREMLKLAAGNAVRAAGLVPAYTGSTASGAWVYQQTPAAGTSANPGTTVTLELRTGPIS